MKGYTMFWMIFVTVWFGLGAWGYQIAFSTYSEIMKTGWWDDRKLYMPFLVVLGPLNLIGQIIAAYKFKAYWYNVWQTGKSTENAKLKNSIYYPREIGLRR